jgi:hypothetical protein
MRDLRREIKDLYRCDCGCGRRGEIWYRELLWAGVCWERVYRSTAAA